MEMETEAKMKENKPGNLVIGRVVSRTAKDLKIYSIGKLTINLQ